MNERVGPTVVPGSPWVPAPDAGNLLRVRNRWADAIYFEGGEATIVEAGMEPDPGIFSQLIHYARKFRADPNFSQYADWPLRLIALVYNDDQSVAQEAPWYGIRWVVYQPDLRGFLPPQFKGSAIDNLNSLLPQDWPARLQSWGIVYGA
jgi:hypothetical protein